MQNDFRVVEDGTFFALRLPDGRFLNRDHEPQNLELSDNDAWIIQAQNPKYFAEKGYNIPGSEVVKVTLTATIVAV